MKKFTELPGVWGDVTSTIDWCEPNYEWSPYVAEPLNTVSNFSFVVLGLIGASHEYLQRSKRAFIYMYLTITCIGLGSMAFHGTLTLLGQEFDELPMVWLMVGCLYVQYQDKLKTKNDEKMGSLVTAIYVAGYSCLHIAMKLTLAFQLHFLVLVLANLYIGGMRFRSIYYTEKEGHIELDPKVKKVVTLHVASGVLGFLFWLIDYHGCEYFAYLRKNNIWHINPNGHVLWHLLMGYCAFCLVVLFRVMDCLTNGKQFRIEYEYGLLPKVYRSLGEFELVGKEVEDTEEDNECHSNQDSAADRGTSKSMKSPAYRCPPCYDEMETI